MPSADQFTPVSADLLTSVAANLQPMPAAADDMKHDSTVPVNAVPVQAELDIFTEENRPSFRIVGQVFSTYWIIEQGNRMLMVDQHAAHEKIRYERLLKQFREQKNDAQMLNPPLILSLSVSEEETFRLYEEDLKCAGFEMGKNSVAGDSVCFLRIVLQFSVTFGNFGFFQQCGRVGINALRFPAFCLEGDNIGLPLGFPAHQLL